KGARRSPTTEGGFRSRKGDDSDKKQRPPTGGPQLMSCPRTLLRLATTTKEPIDAISYSKDGKPCTGDGSGHSADMAALTSVIITAVAAAVIITISPIVVMILSYHTHRKCGQRQ